MKLIRADYIIGFAFILMIFTHSFTQYLITRHTSDLETREVVERYIELAEQNPLAVVALKFNKVKYLYSLFLVPSIMFGIYYWLRKKYHYDQTLLESSTVIIAMSALINFFNDAAILVGYLAR